MAIKTFKPTTPSRRTMSVLSFEEITRDKPEKALTKGKKTYGGRNNNGRTTVRFRGGGHKRRHRLVDFKRLRDGIPAKVVAIEYDPNRTSNIALIAYADGVKSYIIAPQGLKIGQTVQSGTGAEIQVGNVLRLREIPVGTTVCCIELKPGKGAQIVRSAGASAQLMAREGGLATLRLPSTEMRYVPLDSRAMIGQVGNTDHENQTIGKAGRKRWMGKRPHNRGISMNPVDHPLGGGEGATAGGRHPCSPWGRALKGVKTRNPRNPNNRMIIRRRKKKK